MASSEELLLALASAYQSSVAAYGSGRSLARVATIVVNRGSFFTSLARGASCSMRNFDKLVEYFAHHVNWPEGNIPPEGRRILDDLGVRASPHRRAEPAENAQHG